VVRDEAGVASRNDRELTRRQFHRAAAGSLLSLTVLGCGEDKPAETLNNDKRVELATAPFDVGPVSSFQKAGVYTEFFRSHGVYLVSDGSMLVALSAICTHNACGVRWEQGSGQFQCPCHDSAFTREGLNSGGSKAKRPLERCRIKPAALRPGPDPVLRVDPTRRFRQERNEWSSPESMVMFDA